MPNELSKATGSVMPGENPVGAGAENEGELNLDHKRDGLDAEIRAAEAAEETAANTKAILAEQQKMTEGLGEVRSEIENLKDVA